MTTLPPAPSNPRNTSNKMRLSDIAFGFILILFISDFALAAPLPTRGKRDACVDVVPIPKDVMTVLGKRIDEDFDEFAKMVNEYFKTWENPVESSNAHVSSSSAPQASDHGPTADVKAPELNPGSLLAPPGFEHLYYEQLHRLHGSSKVSPTVDVNAPESNPGSLLAPPRPEHLYYEQLPHPELHSSGNKASPTVDVNVPESSPGSLLAPPGPEHLYHEQLPHSELHSSNKASPTSSESDPDYDSESTWEQALQPKRKPRPSKGVDLDIVREYWKNLEDNSPPKRPKLRLKIVYGKHREADPQPSNPGLPSDG